MSEVDIKDNARNRYECIGIIIPDGLLETYIMRWFNGLAQTDSVEEYMNMNRPLNNEICRTQLLTYIRQLDVTKIGTLIQTGSRDFINTMFVMTKEDIKDNAEYRYECFGIVLSDDLLQQYIEKCFDGLTKTDSVKESIDANRCFVNRTFRISLQNYIKQLTLGKIRNLIQTGSRDFVNTMFVITENDIKADSENRQEYFVLFFPIICYINTLRDGLVV
ncbi:unnamed protein product [Mytilus edulis]|uniref:Uncharacterized protein n=1 Tax=Mytilus edulis TaxID=6550 RepID=A0A8S3QQ59_MYTED|nr:unnamed protein product [Mytilus edulis]